MAFPSLIIFLSTWYNVFDIIPAPNIVSAHQRRKAAHTMGACGHGIMSTDIIPAPNVVSAHQRHEVAHTMGACGHGIMSTDIILRRT